MNRKFDLGLRASSALRFVVAIAALIGTGWPVLSASFSGNARVEISDPTGRLSWNPTNNALTVQAWFKISVPSGTNITEDMTILVNRKTGTTNDNHAYHIFFNIATGNIEFSTHGESGHYTKVLIERPYLDRPYHVAVVRRGESFAGYADGREVFNAPGPQTVGNALTTDGVSTGGWNATGSQGRYFFGEVQEVSIYQTARDPEFIVQNMFRDQPALTDNLKGYFKLSFSPNSMDNLKNFAPPPVPAGTEVGANPTTGKIEFEETNQAGEQSYFDSQKNAASGFLVPLSGAFSWRQTLLSRPTPGITFEFLTAYSSANNFEGPLGRGGWRHVFEMRVIPSPAFTTISDVNTVGLLSWDGSIETWDKTNSIGGVSEYVTRSKQYRGELIITDTNCQWTTSERLVYTFRHPHSDANLGMRGRLMSIGDFNGNSVRVIWDETSPRIDAVIDSAEGRHNFAYNARGSLTNVSFGHWSVNFGYDQTNRLISISRTNASGLYTPVDSAWQFAYNTTTTNSLLERVIDPRGNTNAFVQYDKYGRKTNTLDALGRATWTLYGGGTNRTITHVDAEGTKPSGDPSPHRWIETFDRKHRLLSRKDPLGNETQSANDEAGNLTTITEPLGWKTFMAYDNRANVTNIIDALGNVSRRVIHTNAIRGLPHFNKGVQEIDPLGWTNLTAVLILTLEARLACRAGF